MALYGILGDIHGNRQALEAALAALEEAGVERLVCVGDVVGYNADPDACVEMLRRRGTLCIAGNHDLIGTGRLGFERCSNKAMHSLKQTRRRLERDAIDYLTALPSHLRLEPDILLTHGGVRDVQQYMTHPKHVVENVQYLRQDFPGAKVCFFGHTHEQRAFAVEGDRVLEPYETPPESDGCRMKLPEDREHFVNPGSVDASRKRGRRMAEFALYDTHSRVVEFRRVEYDAEATEALASAAGYRIDRWRDRLYDVQRRLIGPPHQTGETV